MQNGTCHLLEQKCLFYNYKLSASSGVIVPMLQERKNKDQLPSEDEVRARLDRLKGVAHVDKGAQQTDMRGKQAQFYQPPDTRSATEQVNHLVTATSAKVVTADECISEQVHE